MSQQQKVRRLVLTGAVTAITVAGAWYGAGLKTQHVMKKVSLLFLVVSLYLLSSQTHAFSPQLQPTFSINVRSEIQEIKSRREATPAEKIAQLEEMRGALVAKRIGLERKIQGLGARKDGRGGKEAASLVRREGER